MANQTPSSDTAAAQPPLPLLFHLDINGTLTPVDSVDHESPDELINMFLARNSFGSVSGGGGGDGQATPQWKWEPAATVAVRPPGAMNYYKYLEQTYGKADAKQRSFRFTHAGEAGEKMAHLVPIIQQYYEAFENFNRRTAEKRAADAAAAKAGSTLSSSAATSASSAPSSASSSSSPLGPVFPSFLALLRRFPSARIIFRTFGVDAAAVVAATEDEIEHSGLPKRHFQGFCLKRLQAEQAKQDEEDPNTLLYKLVPLKATAASASAAAACVEFGPATSEAIGAYLDTLTTDAFILDDYAHWSANSKLPWHGKPIFKSRKYFVIAADDNICMDLLVGEKLDASTRIDHYRTSFSSHTLFSSPSFTKFIETAPVGWEGDKKLHRVSATSILLPAPHSFSRFLALHSTTTQKRYSATHIEIEMEDRLRKESMDAERDNNPERKEETLSSGPKPVEDSSSASSSSSSSSASPSSPFPEQLPFSSSHFILVDPMRALLDEQYFVKEVERIIGQAH